MTIIVLTPKQQQILALIADGCNTGCISEELDISYWSARKRVLELRAKLGAPTMWDIPDRAREMGLEIPAPAE